MRSRLITTFCSSPAAPDAGTTRQKLLYAPETLAYSLPQFLK